MCFLGLLAYWLPEPEKPLDGLPWRFLGLHCDRQGDLGTLAVASAAPLRYGV
jgi:hypothetical protein